MSKRKTRKRHKPSVKPRANHRPVYSTIAEERMNRIVHRMKEAYKNISPFVELARDGAAHLCEEVCKRDMSAPDQADGE